MKKYEIKASDVLDQISNLILVTDKESNFIYTNPYTTKLFGYTSFEEIFGQTPHTVPCPAVESANTFIEQNIKVSVNNKEITLLDFHTYADGKSRILLTKKSPFLLDGQETGIICQATEIQSHTLQKVCQQLIQSDQYYLDRKKQGGSYEFDLDLEDQVTKRERDCLFYLLRGKNKREIGLQLGISPRTVESYLENAKTKLGCYTKPELVDYCIAAGYLKYIPSNLATKELSIIL